MEWFAAKHALLAHLPVAAGLLLPLALVAALRPGRGIRPWWTACRYLGWAGLLGLLASLFSGWALARAQGYLIPGHWLPQSAGPDLRRHLIYSATALPVAMAGLWAMHRPRKEHQGLGILPLFLGLIWATLGLMTGWTGEHLAHPGPGFAHPPVSQPATARPAPPRPVPSPPVDPEAAVPIRALDYAALQPIEAEPVKSQAHGGRWIRVWVDDAAAAAYRTGSPLPEGSLVVMSSVEDRWGRPGPDPGPLYALEMKGGQPRLTFYWPRVPAARLPETGGQARVYWRSPDPHLNACLTCHAGGLLADPVTRSRWKIPSPKGTAPLAPGASTVPAGAGKNPGGTAPGAAPSPAPATPNQ